jgi:hypothetical protein
VSSGDRFESLSTFLTRIRSGLLVVRWAVPRSVAASLLASVSSRCRSPLVRLVLLLRAFLLSTARSRGARLRRERSSTEGRGGGGQTATTGAERKRPERSQNTEDAMEPSPIRVLADGCEASPSDLGDSHDESTSSSRCDLAIASAVHHGDASGRRHCDWIVVFIERPRDRQRTQRNVN